MTVKLMSEHHLECLSLKGGYSGSSESTHVKMQHCWKSHVTAHSLFWKKGLNLKLLSTANYRWCFIGYELSDVAHIMSV